MADDRSVFVRSGVMRISAGGLVLTVLAFPCWAETIIVDQNGSGDFWRIQPAIDYSWDGDIIVVLPGTYIETQGIKFNGRRITLTSLDPNDDSIVNSTIITTEAEGVPCVYFNFSEGADAIITGFTIMRSESSGIGCDAASPTITKNRVSCPGGTGIAHCAGLIANNIIFNCQIGIKCGGGIIRNNIIQNCSEAPGGHNTGFGIEKVWSGTPTVKNNIIQYCERSGLIVWSGGCNNSYNCFYGNERDFEGDTPGTGDFNRDPLLAGGRPQSAAGRWTGTEWVLDDANSPCIDAGDPEDSVGLEPNPNGARINIGAYGGTPQASKSPSGVVKTICTSYPPMDFNRDCKVDYQDFSVFVSSWLECNLDPPQSCWE
jgi:hypothetical protein